MKWYKFLDIPQEHLHLDFYRFYFHLKGQELDILRSLGQPNIFHDKDYEYALFLGPIINDIEIPQETLEKIKQELIIKEIIQ